MEFVRVVRRLTALRRLLLLGIALSVLAGLASVDRVSLFPPKLKSKSLNIGAASTQFLVDTNSSAFAGNPTVNPGFLASTAEIYARLIGTDVVRGLIAKTMGGGVEFDSIAVTTKSNDPTVSSVTEPDANQRASQLLPSTGLALTTQAVPNLPIVTVSATGSTGQLAAKLANAAVSGLAEYIASAPGNTQSSQRLVVRQVGTAVGGQITSSSSRVTGVLIAFGAFIIWCGLILSGSTVKQEWRRLAAEERGATGFKEAPGSAGLLTPGTGSETGEASSA